LFAGNAAVAVSMCVVSFALFAAVPAVVVTTFIVVVSSAVYDLVFGAVSSVSTAAVVTTLGGSVDKVAVLAFEAVVLNAVITALTDAIFASKLNAFSHRFFFWECLPCPGPGILNVIDNKKS